MSNELSSISLAPYRDIIYRHRLSFICTLAVGILLTATAVVLVPDIYLSTTLVTIEPQEVSAQYVDAGVVNHIQDRLKILSEKVLSRTQLEAIIRQFNLYPQRRANHSAMAQLTLAMRSRIDLQVTKEDDHSGGGAFELSFEYPGARVAQAVTARLAENFIAEDRYGRMQQAAATTAFLNDRLADARTKLDVKANEIRAFKDRNQGSLPQDLQVNLQTLSALQGRLQSANEAQLALDERRLQVDREMADARSLTTTSPAGHTVAISPEAQLTALELQLTELRARYGEQYPDVVSLRAEIAALKEWLMRGGSSKQDASSGIDTGFQRETDQIAIEQHRVIAEINGVKRDIALYQQRIADTPGNQQEYDRLNRDYTVLDTEYNTLLNKRLSAQAAQSLEEHGEGEHFRVIDPANLPRSPESPDKTLVAIGGIALSVLAALGIAIGFYMFDTSFKQADEIIRELDLPIAVTIPQLDELADRRAWHAALIRAAIGSGLTLLIGATSIWLYAAHRL